MTNGSIKREKKMRQRKQLLSVSLHDLPLFSLASDQFKGRVKPRCGTFFFFSFLFLTIFLFLSCLLSFIYIFHLFIYLFLCAVCR